uniref:N-acetylmuramoyl-L-alanine amidase-like domain-containing protein n=2 Tax=Desertifilum TaxID=1185872 RepID=A0ACD5GRR4_9CYAN
MSQHRSSYPQLVDNSANYRCIQAMEASIAHQKINYIPQDQIRQRYPQLQPGDIIAVATDIPGLDVTHTGLVYRHPNGNIGLIHASPVGEVTIAEDLQNYISNVESAIGILVARPLDPRQNVR